MTKNLKLDKIRGLRPDKIKIATPIQELLKKDTSITKVTPSRKTVANEKNGAKY